MLWEGKTRISVYLMSLSLSLSLSWSWSWLQMYLVICWSNNKGYLFDQYNSNWSWWLLVFRESTVWNSFPDFLGNLWTIWNMSNFFFNIEDKWVVPFTIQFVINTSSSLWTHRSSFMTRNLKQWLPTQLTNNKTNNYFPRHIIKHEKTTT